MALLQCSQLFHFRSTRHTGHKTVSIPKKGNKRKPTKMRMKEKMIIVREGEKSKHLNNKCITIVPTTQLFHYNNHKVMSSNSLPPMLCKQRLLAEFQVRRLVFPNLIPDQICNSSPSFWDR